MRWAFLFATAFALMACGGATGDATDAGDEEIIVVKKDAGVVIDAGSFDASEASTVVHTDAGYPAPHPAAPQVVNGGGPVLTAPNVVPVFFANDSLEPSLESFMTELAASTFWSEATQEYGVGALTIAPSIVVTDTPPTNISDAQIQTWLANYLDGTHADWPAPTLENIYTIFYPSQTVISSQGLGTSCVNFGGYHYDIPNGQTSGIVYAVMPRCATFGNLKGIDGTTDGLSHELVEASTDPLGTAYAYADLDHMVWNVAPLGEVGDMCAYEEQSSERLVGSYIVQRPWSNLSAAAGHDPCVPVLSTPYFNAAPVLNDVVNLDYYGQEVSTKGIEIPLNASKTIDVDLFSDAPTSQWSVQAVDSTYGTNQPTELQFSWDAQYGNNGDILHLTITRVADGSIGGSEFYLYSERTASDYNMWFGFVAN
jgi:hypothetical protein